MATFAPGSAGSFGFHVHKHQTGSQLTTIGYDVSDGTMFVERSRSGLADFSEDFPGLYRAPLALENGQIRLRILVDWSSVEVFGNGGEAVITAQVFPDMDSDGLELFARGGEARLVSLDLYPVRRIWHAFAPAETGVPQRD